MIGVALHLIISQVSVVGRHAAVGIMNAHDRSQVAFTEISLFFVQRDDCIGGGRGKIRTCELAPASDQDSANAVINERKIIVKQRALAGVNYDAP